MLVHDVSNGTKSFQLETRKLENGQKERSCPLLGVQWSPKSQCTEKASHFTDQLQLSLKLIFIIETVETY